MLAPNPGEPPRPLARIASGGEMSRVALAIKQVLAEVDDTPTLVFDEVDTGIGGRSADPIGRSLWALARRHQVLCVTHLPQIAAHADAHFRIEKRERDGRTVTEVALLDDARARRRAGADARRRRGTARRVGPGAARPGGGVAGGPRGVGLTCRPRRPRPAIDDFLTYLRVERGLSPATIRAYRGDLEDFAAARGAAAGWDRSEDAGRPLPRGAGPARPAAATRASRRPRSGGARRASAASTGSPTARG